MSSSDPAFNSVLEAVRQRGLAHAAYRRPRLPHRVAFAAVIICIFVHIALVIGLYFAMKPRYDVDDDALQAVLLDAPAHEPPLPEPPPVQRKIELRPLSQPFPHAPQTMTHEAAPIDSRQATAAPQRLHIFNPDGSLIEPLEAAASNDSLARKPDFVAKSTAPSALMGPHRPMKLRPNYFASAWQAPRNETLLGETLRKTGDFVDEHLTVRKEFTTPWGSKVDCKASFMLVMAMAGCAWGLPPPPGGRPTAHWKPATEMDEQ